MKREQIRERLYFKFESFEGIPNLAAYVTTRLVKAVYDETVQDSGELPKSSADQEAPALLAKEDPGLITHGSNTEPKEPSFNFGFGSTESDETVLKNRDLLCRDLRISFDRLFFMDQRHSDTSLVITEETKAGEQHTGGGEDGLITRVPETFLAALGADCPVLVLVAPERGGIGVAHCGWRGILKSFPESFLKKYREVVEAAPEQIRIAISPSIHSCCYEVKEDLIDLFGREFGPSIASFILTHRSRYYLDLQSLIINRLITTGIPRSNIEDSRVCTSCSNRLFFSYRCGDSGRFATVVGLRSS